MRKFIYLSLLTFSMMSVTGVSADPAPPKKESATVCEPKFVTVQIAAVPSVSFEVCANIPIETFYPTVAVHTVLPVPDNVSMVSAPIHLPGNPEILPPLQLSRLVTYGIRIHSYGYGKINLVKSLRLTGNVCAQNGRC